MAEKGYPSRNNSNANDWIAFRLPELLNVELGLRNVQMDDVRFVQNCVEQRLPHSGRSKDKRRAFRIAACGSHPKPIFGTIGMVKQFHNWLCSGRHA